MPDARSQRAGLVFGAGGVLGGAWPVGALHAIATETQWDPGSGVYSTSNLDILARRSSSW
jgi:hypothetical protein